MKLFGLFLECICADYTSFSGSADLAVKRKDDTLYLYFEDSDGKIDWSVNLDFRAIPYKRMGKTVFFAHRGFLKLWERTVPLLKDLLLDKAVNNIVTVGYSHGAAVALLCHEYIWHNRPELRDRIEGYGFGCPRVIGARTDRRADARWERFTVIRNLNDIVTHLPPRLLGYRHVGKMLEIGESGRYSLIGAHRPECILKELKALDHQRPLLCETVAK